MRLHVSINRRGQPAALHAARATVVDRTPGGARRGRRAATAAVLSAAAIVATGVTALAGNSITATINVAPPAVKSVTVSVSTLTYSTCSGGSSTSTQLGFPNGACNAAAYTVTNGSTAAEIDVTGADAVPSSGGTKHWVLVSSLAPGVDQYRELVHNASAGPNSPTLSNSAQCDTNFVPSTNPCTDAAGATSSEIAFLTGPSSSTDPSSTFTTTITYTAI
jgi:hypothetical protein